MKPTSSNHLQRIKLYDSCFYQREKFTKERTREYMRAWRAGVEGKFLHSQTFAIHSNSKKPHQHT